MINNDDILLALNEKWDCDLPFWWIPISWDRKIDNTKVYNSHIFEKYITNLPWLIKTLYNIDSVFEIEEWWIVSEKLSVNCEFIYNWIEYIYTNKDYEFVIYFSHEDSVTIWWKKMILEIDKYIK